MRWKRARNGNRKRARSQCNEEGSSISSFSSLLALIIYKPSKLTFFSSFYHRRRHCHEKPFSYARDANK